MPHIYMFQSDHLPFFFSGTCSKRSNPTGHLTMLGSVDIRMVRVHCFRIGLSHIWNLHIRYMNSNMRMVKKHSKAVVFLVCIAESGCTAF